jgi:cellulose synthase/poly-beta-1,6-N-acetylglucosamine synthase-like glycosyltransferase
MSPLLTLAAIIPALPVISFLAYGVLAIAPMQRVLSETAEHIDSDDLFFIFIVPCLNEELVIGASLDRLLAIPGDNWAVMVIDDGSDDATAEIVLRYTLSSQRVSLLRRHRPEARQGKGEALNAAYRYLQTLP